MRSKHTQTPINKTLRTTTCPFTFSHFLITPLNDPNTSNPYVPSKQTSPNVMWSALPTSTPQPQPTIGTHCTTYPTTAVSSPNSPPTTHHQKVIISSCNVPLVQCTLIPPTSVKNSQAFPHNYSARPWPPSHPKPHHERPTTAHPPPTAQKDLQH